MRIKSLGEKSSYRTAHADKRAAWIAVSSFYRITDVGFAQSCAE
jgi:hypothetical protein